MSGYHKQNCSHPVWCFADASWMFTTTATHSSVSYSNDLELCSPSSPVLSQPSRNPVDRSSDNTAGGRLGVRGLLPFATLNLPPVEPTHKWLECQSCGEWASLPSAAHAQGLVFGQPFTTMGRPLWVPCLTSFGHVNRTAMKWGQLCRTNVQPARLLLSLFQWKQRETCRNVCRTHFGFCG